MCTATKGISFMYLDPGFGGMLLQVIIVIAAVGGAILYSMRKRIRDLFKNKKKDSNDENNSTSSTETMHADDDTIDTLAVEKESE